MRGREGGCSSMDENRLHLPLCGQECQDVHAFLQYVLLRIYAFVCVCKLTFFKRAQVVNIHIKHSGLNCDMRECIAIKTLPLFYRYFQEGIFPSLSVCMLLRPCISSFAFYPSSSIFLSFFPLSACLLSASLSLSLSLFLT